MEQSFHFVNFKNVFLRLAMKKKLLQNTKKTCLKKCIGWLLMMIMIKISCFNILSMDIKSDGFVSFSLIVIDCFSQIKYHLIIDWKVDSSFNNTPVSLYCIQFHIQISPIKPSFEIREEIQFRIIEILIHMPGSDLYLYICYTIHCCKNKNEIR